MPRAKKMAVPATPTGLAYGENKALADSQKVVPIRPGGTTPTAAPAPSNDPLAVAQQFTPPNVGLGEETSRPSEPVTAGLGVPTSSLLAPAPASGSLATMLQQAALASGSQSLAELAKRAAELGQ